MSNPRRRITPSDLAYLAHLSTHIANHFADVLARHGEATPIKDGMRSPAPGGGSMAVGTHSDPTVNAALTRTDHADPAVILAEGTRQARVALEALRLTVLAMTLLSAEPLPPMPQCSECYRSGCAMEGTKCTACARKAQRAARRNAA